MGGMEHAARTSLQSDRLGKDIKVVALICISAVAADDTDKKTKDGRETDRGKKKNKRLIRQIRASKRKTRPKDGKKTNASRVSFLQQLRFPNAYALTYHHISLFSSSCQRLLPWSPNGWESAEYPR
jgi:hypothetical protein